MKFIFNTGTIQQFDWNGFVSGGVSAQIGEDKSFTLVSYVEARPKGSNQTFRGEGKNIAEAEEQAWNLYQLSLQSSIAI